MRRNLIYTIPLVAFICGAIACLIYIEMLFNDGWLFALKVIGAIELVVAPLLLYRFRVYLLDQWYFLSWRVPFFLIVSCVFFALMGAPYIFLLNAISSSGEVAEYAGTVTQKWESRRSGCFIQINDQRTGKQIGIQVTRQEYNATPEGAHFSRCMTVGGFDIPYRWRYGLKPTCASHL